MDFENLIFYQVRMYFIKFLYYSNLNLNTNDYPNYSTSFTSQCWCLSVVINRRIQYILSSFFCRITELLSLYRNQYHSIRKMNEGREFLQPLPLTQFLKFKRIPANLDNSSKFQSSHGSSMIGRYHQVLKEKKQLLTDWERIKSRLLRIRKEENRIKHKNNIEQKRKDYITKFRETQHCSSVTAKDNSSQSLNPRSIDSDSRLIHCKSSEHTLSRREKIPQLNNTMHSNVENFQEWTKHKASLIKKERNFNERFIEERRQIEFDRKLVTAQTVKRHRQKKKENNIRLTALKNFQTASEIQRKIQRQLKQCSKIEGEVIRLYTAESSMSKSEAGLSRASHRPKLLFQRIL